jgi:hypothetical protein
MLKTFKLNKINLINKMKIIIKIIYNQLFNQISNISKYNPTQENNL